MQSQRFSKLTEDQDFDLDSESRDTTPSPLDSSQEIILHDEEETVSQESFDAALKDTLEDEDDDDLFSLPDEMSINVHEVSIFCVLKMVQQQTLLNKLNNF